MKKYIISIIIFIFLSTTALASSSLFVDIDESHWAYKPIKYLYDNNILNGYSDGTFKPNNYVTRAELASVIYKLEQKNTDNDSQIINMVANRLNSIVHIKVNNKVGTGVIVDKTYILTAKHVVKDKELWEFQITSFSNFEHSATKIILDEKSDLALIKFDPIPNYTPIPLANKVYIGETAIAIGHPKGMEFTVTKGIVSNTKAELGNEILLQTDAALNHGNSGGAILNSNGELIGIASRIIADTEGLNFAVGIGDIHRFLDENLPK